MEHTKKMVLIPEDAMDKMRQQSSSGSTQHQLQSDAYTGNTDNSDNDNFNNDQTILSTQTPGTPLSRLDAEMSKILRSSQSDDREKWRMYHHALQRYLFFADEARKTPITPATTDKGLPDDKIIATVPQRYRRKAEILIHHLHTAAPRITWDQQGVISIDGLQIQSSNIIDLVNDAMRSRKNIKPSGRLQFMRVLRSINTPREFIGNTELWNQSGGNSTRRTVTETDTINTPVNHTDNSPPIERRKRLNNVDVDELSKITNKKAKNPTKPWHSFLLK